MFEQVGSKIRKFATFTFWLFLVAGIGVGAFIGLDNMDGYIDGILLGIGIAIGGGLLGMVSAWFVYAYGEITEAAEGMLYSKSDASSIGSKILDERKEKIE